jgi:steroid delta-isomerase-like uncharacterized protein
MSIEKMDMLIQRFDDMFNMPDMSIADEILAPLFVAHVPLMPTLNRAHFKSFIESFYDAFPDFGLEINDSIMTNERLVLRLTFCGTHDGDFLGIATTGQEVLISGMSIFQIENGLIVENWMEMDIFGAIRQISEIPHTVAPLASMN